MAEWIIDGEINLTGICESAEWHRLTAIEELSKQLPRSDAEAFVDLAFADAAQDSDVRAQDCVNDAQWERLTIV